MTLVPKEGDRKPFAWFAPSISLFSLSSDDTITFPWLLSPSYLSSEIASLEDQTWPTYPKRETRSQVWIKSNLGLIYKKSRKRSDRREEEVMIGLKDRRMGNKMKTWIWWLRKRKGTRDSTQSVLWYHLLQSLTCINIFMCLSSKFITVSGLSSQTEVIS